MKRAIVGVVVSASGPCRSCPGSSLGRLGVRRLGRFPRLRRPRHAQDREGNRERGRGPARGALLAPRGFPADVRHRLRHPEAPAPRVRLQDPSAGPARPLRDGRIPRHGVGRLHRAAARELQEDARAPLDRQSRALREDPRRFPEGLSQVARCSLRFTSSAFSTPRAASSRRKEAPIYQVVRKGVDFISLDNADEAGFSREQLVWLARVLAADAADDSVKTIVAGMHAALPYSTSRGHAMDATCAGLCSGQQAYDLLFRAQNLAGPPEKRKHVYVLASHSHYFLENIYDTPEHRGQVLPGWIIGTAGAQQYQRDDPVRLHADGGPRGRHAHGPLPGGRRRRAAAGVGPRRAGAHGLLLPASTRGRRETTRSGATAPAARSRREVRSLR